VGKLEPAAGGGGGLVTLAPGDDFDGRSSVQAAAQVVAQVLSPEPEPQPQR